MPAHGSKTATHQSPGAASVAVAYPAFGRKPKIALCRSARRSAEQAMQEPVVTVPPLVAVVAATMIPISPVVMVAAVAMTVVFAMIGDEGRHRICRDAGYERRRGSERGAGDGESADDAENESFHCELHADLPASREWSFD